ncbi:unnamed protein product [Linum trigynum]|uniref:Uncharacterized protein n=1 Tax=Linum trigynum TaxID=586398 RepID=A0AAV2EG32_9ROSI
MAAAIVSQVLSQLGSIVTEELKQRGRLVLGAEKDVEKLTSTFTAIEALLLDAEERQLKSASIENWLKKLKDVSYEIDDMLDEWRTEILKQRLEGDDDVVGGCLELKLLQISDVLKRVCPFLPVYCFSTHEIGLRYDIASRIKSLNERLDDIDKEKILHNFTPKQTASFSSLPTSSVIDFSDLKVRQGEFEILRGKLLDDGGDHPSVRSISIQGLGGFGKTTLAKMLYNDKKVEDHFSKRIWVCVSANFVQETFAKAILESFKQFIPKDSSLSYMLEHINTLAKDEKFLLVLDDVWEDSRSKWEELISSVSHGLPGSKILVTTRKEDVSHVFCRINKDIFPLQKISDGECRTIFTQIAFYGWSDEERECIEDLCERVVEKCSGSPLAAKVLGGLLHVKKSKKDWIKLLGSEMWQIEKGRDEVLAPLALSYYDLPSAVRQCFQFCSVFPQDSVMMKEELIKLWMSQGFLKATMNQDMEEVGEEYFQILVMRSFFQDVEKKLQFVDEKTFCKMHDLVHDFARLTTKNECISILEQDSSLLLIINEVRHLMVKGLSSEDTNKLISSIVCSRLSSTKRNHYLRSFIVRNRSAIEPHVYAYLRGIRSLILKFCDLREIPSTIAQLIHLRYLDLSDNDKLMELPEEICELCNLETLLINLNGKLNKLPSGMGNKLVNLKHLENYMVPAVLPKSMARLGNSLKTLTTFNVAYDDKADAEGARATNIGDLECMNRIQGALRIAGLSKVTNCEEVKRAELAKKEFLIHLCLEFDSDEEEEEADHKDEQVLEAIIPSSRNLEQLRVLNYRGGSIFPSWLMSLSNLMFLEFNGCHEVEHLPAFGTLPSLEELQLSCMDKVKEVGLEFFLGTSTVIQQQGMTSNNKSRDIIIAFPKLTRLVFWTMKNWKVWDLECHEKEGMDSSTTVMPRLRFLQLIDCAKLEKVPDVLLRKTTLKQLVIYDSGGLGSYRFDPQDPKMMPNDAWDKISHIPTIILDGDDIRTTFKSEIDSMSGFGCSYSKEE